MGCSDLSPCCLQAMRNSDFLTEIPHLPMWQPGRQPLFHRRLGVQWHDMCAEALGIPKVALMFLSRGPIHQVMCCTTISFPAQGFSVCQRQSLTERLCTHIAVHSSPDGAFLRTDELSAALAKSGTISFVGWIARAKEGLRSTNNGPAHGVYCVPTYI